MTTIADVAFDVPLAHSFAYRVPDGWTLAPGQRVVAPLRGASRVGMIVALRDGADARLKTLDRVVDAEPVLSPSHLDLVHWIAAQSLSSVGSTCAALLPPPTTTRTPDAAPRRAADAATRTASDVSASPGGRPRIHSRDVAFERAARERLTLLLTSATPSVEAWRRVESGLVDMTAPPRGPWPAVSVADTRRILRREPLTPPLARAIRETLAARRRVFLAVSRLTSSLACDECGTVVRCAECAIAFAYTRAAARLVCRLCATSQPLPETCAVCHGRRLSPFGWGAERVEHAVRRRFPDARIARWEPDAARGARAEAQRAAAAAADVVIGTRGALRLFGPAALGLAAFVAPDQLLRAPDFRAGERALGLAWAAAERVAADGALIIQSQNPEHYAFGAVARQNLHEFYQHELTFRAEPGHPPFRPLAVVTTRAREAAETSRLAQAIGAALRGGAGLTVYPPVADRRDRAHRIVVKGDTDLPRLLEEALREFKTPRSASRGIIDVEVDPVEWQY